MKFTYTTLFQRSLRKLRNLDDRKRIKRSIECLCAQPYYPFPKGLSVHLLRGVTGTSQRHGERAPVVWEMHASAELLVTFQYSKDEIIFRNCGHHDAVLRSP